MHRDKEKKEYTVYVGGVEVVDYLVTKQKARRIASSWRSRGYADVAIVKVD